MATLFYPSWQNSYLLRAGPAVERAEPHSACAEIYRGGHWCNNKNTWF